MKESVVSDMELMNVQEEHNLVVGISSTVHYTGATIVQADFGKGACTDHRGGCGGGGWYGGGASVQVSASGGSGWVYTEANYNAWKSGNSTDANKYLLNSSYYLTDAQTIAGNQPFPNVAGTGNETGHSGNGAAKITPVN